METIRIFDYVIIRLFKSYYVVWKPLDTKTFVIQTTQFKSYYVVWKPSQAGQSRTQKQRLNRTM